MNLIQRNTTYSTKRERFFFHIVMMQDNKWWHQIGESKGYYIAEINSINFLKEL